MDDFDRRSAIRLGGLALAAATAGCLAEGTEPTSGNGDDTASGNGAADGETGADGIAETDTVQLGPLSETPVWRRRDEAATGHVLLVDSRERLEAGVRFPTGDDEAVASFVEATDLGESILLFVESEGPNTCYDELVVESLSLEDGLITGTAAASDSGGEACGEAITYPGALVRVTPESGEDAPSRASLTVVDGWGEEATVEATVDDPLSPDPEELPGYVRPENDPDHVPPELECDDEEFRRLSASSDVDWGESAGLALRVDSLAVERGETVDVSMTNVSDEEAMTGNASKFGLEVYTDAGWQEVRGYRTERGPAYTDEGVIHPPGTGFDWTLEMSAAGLEGEGYPDLEVCPELPAGRYRFVYWEPGIAVAFDLLE